MAYPIKHGFIAITPEISGPYIFNVEEYGQDHPSTYNNIDYYCESLLRVLFEEKSWIKYIVLRNKKLSLKQYCEFLEAFFHAWDFVFEAFLNRLPNNFEDAVADSLSVESHKILPKTIIHCDNEKQMQPIKFQNGGLDSFGNIINIYYEKCDTFFDGFHLTSSFVREIYSSKKLQEKLKANTHPKTHTDTKGIIGASCHTEKDLFMAQEIGADYCFLSPLKSIDKDYPNLSWSRFSKMVSSVKMPVYALGGLKFDDLETSRKYGAAGIAGISMYTGDYY